MFRRRRIIAALQARRQELALALIRSTADPFHPTPGHQHTQGMYDGLNYAISLLEERE